VDGPSRFTRLWCQWRRHRRRGWNWRTPIIDEAARPVAVRRDSRRAGKVPKPMWLRESHEDGARVAGGFVIVVQLFAGFN